MHGPTYLYIEQLADTS